MDGPPLSVDEQLRWLPAPAQIMLGGKCACGPYGQVLLTQERINAFAEVSGDDNPIHLERGVAHGMLLISMLPTLLAPMFRVLRNGGVQLFDLGGRDFSFPHFARVGALLQASLTVSDVRFPGLKKVDFDFGFTVEQVRSGRAPQVVAVGTRTLQCCPARGQGEAAA